MREIELKPVKESTEDYEAIERKIIELFKQEIYYPLLKILAIPQKAIKNSQEDLIRAIHTGRITYDRGKFSGKLNANISKGMREIGAKWDKGFWRLPAKKLTPDLRIALVASRNRLQKSLKQIDETLSKLIPAEIAEKLKVENLFDSTLWKVDRDFNMTLKGITVAPKLTPARRKRIADEYTNNLRLYIQEWTQKEIVQLRERMQKHIFAGARHEDAVDMIRKSYGVSLNKAKFLARQETSLLMTKFKQTRYEDAGVNEYKWGCVVGSPRHPVRPIHKSLEGKVFRWDNPPITSENGARNNPGQDYNCRCFARPIVKF